MQQVADVGDAGFVALINLPGDAPQEAAVFTVMITAEDLDGEVHHLIAPDIPLHGVIRYKPDTASRHLGDAIGEREVCPVFGIPEEVYLNALHPLYLRLGEQAGRRPVHGFEQLVGVDTPVKGIGQAVDI